jgi:hypothetical protein
VSCRPRPTPISIPIELGALRISGSVTNALQNGLSLVLVNSAGMGDQTGNRLAVPSDHNFFASLHTIKQGTECILGFKSSNPQ